jgi:branched-chain amino acid transport system permease protein
MRIPNLTHGSMFMLGAYFGTTLLSGVLGVRFGFWLAAVVCAVEVAITRAFSSQPALKPAS